MKVVVFDAESNGFLDVADTLHCIATVEDVDYSVPVKLFTPKLILQGLAELRSADVLVGHNIKKFDLPLFKKLYDWEPKSHQVVIDTLVFSRMLNPKRPLPEGYKGRATHSIEAWGHRLDRHKPDHTEWGEYSEAMGTRCKEDTKINLLVLKELEREAGDLSSYYQLLKDS